MHWGSSPPIPLGAGRRNPSGMEHGYGPEAGKDLAKARRSRAEPLVCVQGHNGSCQASSQPDKSLRFCTSWAAFAIRKPPWPSEALVYLDRETPLIPVPCIGNTGAQRQHSRGLEPAFIPPAQEQSLSTQSDHSQRGQGTEPAMPGRQLGPQKTSLTLCSHQLPDLVSSCCRVKAGAGLGLTGSVGSRLPKGPSLC